MKRQYPSQDELLEMFHDMGTHLVWKMPSRGRSVGKEAGSNAGKGYLRVSINDKSYMLHIVMWIMRHGSIPEGYEIDHKDTNGLNNIDDNMRLATRSQNSMNRSMCSLAGVYFRSDRNKWYARIKVNAESIHLGSFENEEAALKARAAAEEKYFGEFTFQDS